MTGILKRESEEGRLDAKTKAAIRAIAESCETCNTQANPPRRFKLSIGSEYFRFNHHVQIDTMFISGKPVLHLADEAMHFQATSFLHNQSAKEIWRTLQAIWSLTYLGPPDFLWVDQGSSYVSTEMMGNLEAAVVTLREAPIESPGTIGVVERYHAPLKAAYRKIRSEMEGDVSDSDCLSMAVYSVNCTVGPEGLCPVLLVLWARPRLARSLPAPTQIARSIAIEKATIEAGKEQARCRY